MNLSACRAGISSNTPVTSSSHRGRCVCTGHSASNVGSKTGSRIPRLIRQMSEFINNKECIMESHKWIEKCIVYLNYLYNFWGKSGIIKFVISWCSVTFLRMNQGYGEEALFHECTEKECFSLISAPVIYKEEMKGKEQFDKICVFSSYSPYGKLFSTQVTDVLSKFFLCFH